jgi:hypothetical protein
MYHTNQNTELLNCQIKLVTPKEIFEGCKEMEEITSKEHYFKIIKINLAF